MNPDALLGLLQRFQAEGVAYVLVGGHAVRLNGFNRNTEDIDILLPSSLKTGARSSRPYPFYRQVRSLKKSGSHHPPESRKISGLLTTC